MIHDIHKYVYMNILALFLLSLFLSYLSFPLARFLSLSRSVSLFLSSLPLSLDVSLLVFVTWKSLCVTHARALVFSLWLLYYPFQKKFSFTPSLLLSCSLFLSIFFYTCMYIPQLAPWKLALNFTCLVSPWVTLWKTSQPPTFCAAWYLLLPSQRTCTPSRWWWWLLLLSLLEKWYSNCVWNSLVFSYLALMNGVVCVVCPFVDDEKLKNTHVDLALLVWGPALLSTHAPLPP